MRYRRVIVLSSNQNPVFRPMFLNLARNSVLVFKHRFRAEYAVKHFLFFWPAHHDSVQAPGQNEVSD